MYCQSFESDLRTKLIEKNVSEPDVAFIMEQIHHGECDENLIMMRNEVYQVLEERGIRAVFEESCNELGFNFTHSNEPER